jgi:hypothetical protein
MRVKPGKSLLRGYKNSAHPELLFAGGWATGTFLIQRTSPAVIVLFQPILLGCKRFAGPSNKGAFDH